MYTSSGGLSCASGADSRKASEQLATTRLHLDRCPEAFLLRRLARDASLPELDLSQHTGNLKGLSVVHLLDVAVCLGARLVTSFCPESS